MPEPILSTDCTMTLYDYDVMHRVQRPAPILRVTMHRLQIIEMIKPTGQGQAIYWPGPRWRVEAARPPGRGQPLAGLAGVLARPGPERAL